MSDQADKLRALRLVKGGVKEDRTRTGNGGAHPRVRSLAVTSGKGGVGKTSVATNLALAFAGRGKKVLLVDGDLALANVDLLFGVVPHLTLGDVVNGSATLEEILIETRDGVRILPAGSGVAELADLDDFRRERLFRELASIEDGCDLLILDTGSGIGRQAMSLARAADQIIVVTTPEPTAFSDAYATLKVLHSGRLRGRPGVLVNMTGSAEEGRETERRIRMVAERFLDIRVHYYGHVPFDTAVGQAVRRQEPLLKAYPQSPAAASLGQLAHRLLHEPVTPEPEQAVPDGFFQKVANLDG